MPTEIPLPAAVHAFLPVLARVGGAVVFVPLPGLAASPEPARIVMAVALTVALYPMWPVVEAAPSVARLVGWMISEAAFGLTIGLVTGFLAEAFLLCGQMVGLQAGYSYASTIDPNTQADSTVMSILMQLMAGLLFFSLGFDRWLLGVFARSLASVPPGGFLLKPVTAEAVVQLSGSIFSTGLRLALPIVAMLVMVDLALALAGRMQPQLQLISIAFPGKMLTALAMLVALAALFARVYQEQGAVLFNALERIALGR